VNDSYLFAFVGPQDDNRSVGLGETIDGSNYSAPIKCTRGVVGISILAGHVIGGKDACVDINDGAKNAFVSIVEAEATGQFVATIKGGAIEPVLWVANVTNHGKGADVILGDWSDQRHDWVKKPILNVSSKNGPATVIWLASDRPNLVAGSGPYRFKYWPRWTPAPIHAFIVFCFNTLRRWGLFRSKS
jgi:hypothetical protein